MKRLTLFAALGLALSMAVVQAADNRPKVIDSRLAVGANASRTQVGQAPVLDVADPVAGVRVLQVRPDTTTTYPFQTFEHRTTAAGSAVTKYEWRIDSSGNLILRDVVGSADRLTVDFTTGAVTFGTAPTLSGLTASRLVVTDASKNLASNGAVTTNNIPRSASSGATLVASALADDGTTVTSSRAVSVTGNITGSGKIIDTPQAVTAANDGAGTLPVMTITPTASVVTLDCSDTDGCTAVMSETGAVAGQIVIIVNIGSFAVTFADTGGVSEMAGAVAVGATDSVSLAYVGTSWYQIAAANN